MNENNKQREEIEIDLRGLFLCYLRKWWLILLCGVVAAAGTFFLVKQFVQPKYRASVTMYVNNVKNDVQVEYISSTNLTAAQTLVSTYVNIIKSDTVMERVIEEAKLDIDAATLKSMISASQIDETEMFRIYITSTDPRVAAALANAVADVAVDAMADIIEGSSVKIIDRAKVPSSPFSPSYLKYTALGGIGGCLVVMVILTILFLLDVKVKDAEDLERLFDLPVLGQIPDFGAEGKHGYGKNGYGKYSYSGYSTYGAEESDSGKEDASDEKE